MAPRVKVLSFSAHTLEALHDGKDISVGGLVLSYFKVGRNCSKFLLKVSLQKADGVFKMFYVPLLFSLSDTNHHISKYPPPTH